MRKVLRRFARAISLVLITTVFAFAQQPPIVEKCDCPTPPSPPSAPITQAWSAAPLGPFGPAPANAAAAFDNDHAR